MPTFDVGYLKRESNRMRQALVWGFSVRFQCFIELSALIRAVERSEPTDDALAAFQTEARRLAQLVALSQPSLVGASRFAKTLLRDGHTNEVAGQWTFSSLSDDAWETLCRYPSDTATMASGSRPRKVGPSSDGRWSRRCSTTMLRSPNTSSFSRRGVR